MLSRTRGSDETNDEDDGNNGNSNSNALAEALAECMSTNQLSPEAFLARFFSSSVLGTYCANVLGLSGKGNEAVLAARIARRWSKPGFDPTPKKAGETKAAAAAARSARESSPSSSSLPEKDTIAQRNNRAVEQLDGKVGSKVGGKAGAKPKGSKPEKKRAGSSVERVGPTRDGKRSDDSRKKSRTLDGSDGEKAECRGGKGRDAT